MIHFRGSLVALAASGSLVMFAPGCATRPDTSFERRFGESVILVGDEPAGLAHVPTGREPVEVRSTYLNEPDTFHYAEGRDYVLDREQGTLQRTAESRLPDFRKNVLFGRENFDHNQFPGFGNSGYFAFVDYAFKPAAPWPRQPSQAHLLRAARARLKSGQSVKIVAYGDSITAGGDASRPELIFWHRWAGHLQQKYPAALISAANGGTIGDSTAQGLQRLEAKVLNEKPDLVLVGFGMNDHNVGGVPLPLFEANLKELIARIRDANSAEVVLFSAFPPNPKWKFGTHRMEEYAAATARVARETGCAFADVFGNWQALAARKKPEDLLGNNINHPNDFGHWIYYRVLQELGL